jgi:PAS domain S-box-containing protein
LVESVEDSLAIALDEELNIVSCNQNFIKELRLKKKDCLKLPLSNTFKVPGSVAKIKSGDFKKIDLALLKDPTQVVGFNISPILLNKSKTGFFLIGKALKVKKDWDQDLLKILKGTYNDVGGDFFKSITKELAKTLGVKYAFIGEVSYEDPKKPMVEAISFWSNKGFINNYKYNLAGTPCEHVIDRKQLIVLDKVNELYPKDEELAKLKIRSYIGTPIFYKDGRPLGLVVLMDTKPIQIKEENAYKLHLFTSRIGIELEWFKNDILLTVQESKLRTILKSLPNPVYVQNNEGVYEACNDAFLDFFNLEEKDIVNQPINKLPKSILNNKILSATQKLKKTEGVNRIESSIQITSKTKKDAIVIISPIKDNFNHRTGIVGVVLDISEMKESEKLLKIREEKYRTLFNKANDAFLLMSNDTFIDCNPKALEMFGCSKETLIGSSPQLFSPNIQPDKQNSTTKALQKIEEALSGKAPTFYWKHKKHNGNLFDAEVSLNAFYIEGDLLVQAIVRDVSSNVKATEDIEKQTQRMKKMYALTSDTHTPFNEKVSNILKMATVSLGMQVGGISKVEGENYEILDHYSLIPFSVEDINYLSKTYCSITIAENRLVAVPKFTTSIYSNKEVFKLLQFDSYIGVPYWVKGKLRGTIWFTSFYSVKEFKSLDADFVQIIAQWIGSSFEREEYEESLRKNEALLGTLLREIPLDFSVRDTDLRMMWQSNKSKDIWGNNEGKLIRYYYDTEKETSDKWRDIFARVLKGESIRGEDNLKIFGVPHQFYSIASPIMVNNKVEQVMVINIDISQLKKAEKKLKTQNNKLKKLNTELDRFVYSASHDLRAPLASLLGLIDLSQREQLNPALKQYLQLMNTSIIKLDSFISDITDYSRNLRLKPKVERIYFNVFINDIYNGLAFMNPQKMNFSLKIKGRAIFYSDPDRLKLILSNLISNSIRYRSKNHILKINVEVTKTKENVKIKISDNGLGIQNKYQAKVFEMFYRANDQNTGSGLGLFIVKETMDKLKGKISLESVVNRGTTFLLNIPNSKVKVKS